MNFLTGKMSAEVRHPPTPHSEGPCLTIFGIFGTALPSTSIFWISTPIDIREINIRDIEIWEIDIRDIEI